MKHQYASLRVLIVDENRFTRELIAGVLEDIGFQKQNLMATGDGKEALDLLGVKKVDFIICDVQIGSIDGLTFVRTLRKPGECPVPGIPVIICSGQLDKKRIEEIQEAGVNEVVLKPVSLGAVESRIRALLLKPRPLVNFGDYIGPDRRRVMNDEIEVERRSQGPDEETV